MIPLLDNYGVVKNLYGQYIEPVCQKYDLTHTELNILLFLANNPESDTATDIVQKRRIAKSHVSSSLRTLEERGYVTGEFRGRNRRSIHLKILEKAQTVIDDGRQAQRGFAAVILEGFDEEELVKLGQFLERMKDNIFKATEK